MRIKIGNKDISMSIILLLVAIYIILKVCRNSINYADSTQGGIWNFLLIILVVWGIISFVFCKCDFHIKPIKIAFVYCAIVWVNGIVTVSVNSALSAYYLMVAPCFAVIFILVYMVSVEEITKGQNRFWNFSWFVIMGLLLYTYIKFFGAYKYYESSGVIALNNSYYAACAIPFFLKRKDKFGFVMIVLALFIVFISNKRAGLIAVFVALAMYYIVNSKISNNMGQAIKRLLIGSIAAILFTVSFFYIDAKYNLGIVVRLNNLFVDGGSGRLEIYKYVFEQIIDSNIFQIIFGHGVSSINHMDMKLSSAHCDFLNVWYEYGLIAVLLLVSFYGSMARWLKKMIKSRYTHCGAFGFSLVVSLMFSLFSANLDSQSFSIVLAVYWAIEISEYERYRVKLEGV